jgi:nucleoside-diphosphate-sugar epimerase
VSSLSSKRLLVTGGSGFLGSAVVDLALHAGWQVRALSRSSRLIPERVEPFVGDICDGSLIREACDGVTAVIHAAGLAHIVGRDALHSTRFNNVNVLGTAELVSGALECGVPRLVLVSSVSVYGRYPGPKCDETVPCHPSGSYANSKRLGELRAIELAGTGRCSLSILRLATVYGEGDRGNVARLIGAIDRGRFIWAGSGDNQKSLIYKEDAARACLLAVDRSELTTEIFNVSTSPCTMREILTAICDALGRPVPQLAIPLSLLRPTSAFCRSIGDPLQFASRLEKFLRDDVYDGTRFITRFGFFPQVPLREGIRKEVEFLHEYKQE